MSADRDAAPRCIVIAGATGDDFNGNPSQRGKGERRHLVLSAVNEGLEVFLVHPGGPFWAKRDLGSWSVPKGEIDGDEDLLEAAKREFHEETGARLEGDFVELAALRQPSGKVVHVWAVEGEIDASSIASNTFSIEWPPQSGETREFPEVDRAEWFTLAEDATSCCRVSARCSTSWYRRFRNEVRISYAGDPAVIVILT